MPLPRWVLLTKGVYLERVAPASEEVLRYQSREGICSCQCAKRGDESDQSSSSKGVPMRTMCPES